jgi:hypothetical protein
MIKYLLTLGIVIAAVFVLSSLGSYAFAQRGETNPVQPPAALPGLGSDSNPFGKPDVIIPEMYQPTASALAAAAASPVSTVYFTPQDENTNTTVLFLYSTNNQTTTVGLKTFYLNGSLTISTTVAVPPNGLVRICGDTVSTVSASWANYVLINFTTFSTYAQMTLPAGVKAEAYVAWNTTGIYDPLTAVQTLPIRFSTDPSTVFLPALPRN